MKDYILLNNPRLCFKKAVYNSGKGAELCSIFVMHMGI